MASVEALARRGRAGFQARVAARIVAEFARIQPRGRLNSGEFSYNHYFLGPPRRANATTLAWIGRTGRSHSRSKAVSPTPRVRLIVENESEKRFVEAFFQPEIESAHGEVIFQMTRSGAIAFAEFSLLRDSEHAVALVLNSETEDEYALIEQRGTLHRILSRDAPNGWYVALAIPYLDAWAMIDPLVKAEFEKDPLTRRKDRTGFARRALRLQQLVRERPFDRAALVQASTQFRGLVEFIQQALTTKKKEWSEAVSF